MAAVVSASSDSLVAAWGPLVSSSCSAVSLTLTSSSALAWSPALS